jgi:SAM-dependent methyltransferase
MVRTEHPLHSMSSYLGGFPPRVPRRLIQEWVPSRTTVLDPFCGSGTTIVEAKLLGHPAVGVDLNPLAVRLTQAKLQPVDLDEVLYRLRDLAKKFRGEREIDEVPEILNPIFHTRTLAQLCYLKKELRDDNPEDVFLKGALLGIMHGKVRRDGTTAYLSVDMPNTFSMSPGYVRKFVEKNGLEPPAVDVFSKLGERSAWLLRAGSLPRHPRSVISEGDATRLAAILPQLGIRTVGAIITSPPYLGVLRYGTYNWIRLWFLGYSQYQIDGLLDGTDSLEVYLSFMASFLLEASRVLRPGGIAALVIGDVIENGQHLHLAERVWEELDGIVNFELEQVQIDTYDQTAKTTRIWGKDRRGQATPMDRVLILRRVPSRRKPATVAQHVRAKHKRAKKRDKKEAENADLSERINRTIEAIGILKCLQVSPRLSEEEKKLLGAVAKTIEELMLKVRKGE